MYIKLILESLLYYNINNDCRLPKFKQVRYIGVSNETSYGVMEFVHAAKVEGLPKIVSIQNNYSMLVRCKFESKLYFKQVLSCHNFAIQQSLQIRFIVTKIL